MSEHIDEWQDCIGLQGYDDIYFALRKSRLFSRGFDLVYKQTPKHSWQKLVGSSQDFLADRLAQISWQTEPQSIPFDVEVLVAWNFTNSRYTTSVMIRHADQPDCLWLDTDKRFINLSYAKYWRMIPAIPENEEIDHGA